MRVLSLLTLLTAAVPARAAFPAGELAARKPHVTFERFRTKIAVKLRELTLTTYVFSDPRVKRPYFANLKARDGTQVTRHHPPRPGIDRTDHATMHPGLWLAFGDISGEDFWRNKAEVLHESFLKEPETGSFQVRNRYVGSHGTIVCYEKSTISFLLLPQDYLILWDAVFSATQRFSFGDQEEMGLGLRIATELTVREGGRILSSKGRKNEEGVWGTTARWCDYSGTVSGRTAGCAILCHPGNFRPSWFHARDYGLLVANPFGRHAFRKGPPSRVVVEPGRTLRLRYGIYVHSRPKERPPDVESVWRRYLRAARRIK